MCKPCTCLENIQVDQKLFVNAIVNLDLSNHSGCYSFSYSLFSQTTVIVIHLVIHYFLFDYLYILYLRAVQLSFPYFLKKSVHLCKDDFVGLRLSNPICAYLHSKRAFVWYSLMLAELGCLRERFTTFLAKKRPFAGMSANVVV